MLKTSEEIDPKQFIGMLEEDAENLATELGYIPRVISVDGEHGTFNMGFHSGRINFDIDNGVVTGTHIG